jgi:hypothetical protein
VCPRLSSLDALLARSSCHSTRILRWLCRVAFKLVVGLPLFAAPNGFMTRPWAGGISLVISVAPLDSWRPHGRRRRQSGRTFSNWDEKSDRLLIRAVVSRENGKSISGISRYPFVVIWLLLLFRVEWNF